MIDRSLPHMAIFMEKRDAGSYPRYELPAGYSFLPFSPGMEKVWAELQLVSEHLQTAEQAGAIWNTDYAPQSEKLPSHMYFVVDEGGAPVSVNSVWDGTDFGGVKQKIHWVATHPLHQKKGLAKALMTRVMDAFNEVYGGGYIYLATQTESWAAIGMYLDFGFEFYRGSCPLGFKYEGNFEEATLHALEIVKDKLRINY